MVQHMDKGHTKTAQKFIQESGAMILDTALAKKSLRIANIAIKASSQVISIMDKAHSRMKNQLIQATFHKGSLMEKE